MVKGPTSAYAVAVVVEQPQSIHTFMYLWICTHYGSGDAMGTFQRKEGEK
jgi:hypothetical protein